MENQQKRERKRRAKVRTVKQGNNHIPANRWSKRPLVKPRYSGL